MIGLVFATYIEAEPFIIGLNLKQKEKKPFPIYENEKIILTLTGIGKINSAVATTLLINKYELAILLNLGAAGSTTEKYKIGDILHIKNCVEYDRPTLLKTGKRFFKPDLLEGFQKETLATQDIAITDPQTRKEISKTAGLVDMEGAAFIQACRMFQKKCYLFKIVTDTPIHTQDKDIIKNVKLTRDKLFDFFIKEIELKI